MVQRRAHVLREVGSDALIKVLKKAMQGSADNPVKLMLGWEFNAQSAATAVGTFTQVHFCRRFPGALRAEPRFEGGFVLPRGKAPAYLRPNYSDVGIMTSAMPRILRRVIPQELELMRDERPDHLRHLLQLMREIAQVLYSLE